MLICGFIKNFFVMMHTNIRTAFLGRGTNIHDWKFDFVHHIVKEPYELELIKKKGIGLIDFKDIITELFEKMMNLGTS